MSEFQDRVGAVARQMVRMYGHKSAAEKAIRQANFGGNEPTRRLWEAVCKELELIEVKD